MAKKTQGPGIQSAAGLIRYYDAEEKSRFQISPSAVLVFSLVVGILTVCLKVFWDY